MTTSRLDAAIWIAIAAIVAAQVPARAAVPRRLAVLDVRVGGHLDARSVDGLSSLIASEVATQDPAMQVISSGDVRAMVGFEKQKDLLGCSEASCLAEIGGALGVDLLVVSEGSVCVEPGRSRSLAPGGDGGDGSEDGGSGGDADAGGAGAGGQGEGGGGGEGGTGGEGLGSGGEGGDGGDGVGSGGEGGGGAPGGAGGGETSEGGAGGGGGEGGSGGGPARFTCDEGGWRTCHALSSSYVCKADACADTCSAAPAGCLKADACGPAASSPGVVVHDLEQIPVGAFRCNGLSGSCPLLTSLCKARFHYRAIDGALPEDVEGRLRIRTSDGSQPPALDASVAGDQVTFSFCTKGFDWLSVSVLLDDGAGPGLVPSNRVCAAGGT